MVRMVAPVGEDRGLPRSKAGAVAGGAEGGGSNLAPNQKGNFRSCDDCYTQVRL